MPVCLFARAYHCRRSAEESAFGYDEMPKRTFYGLKREDVDLERGALRLKRALVRGGGKTASGDLKTAKRPRLRHAARDLHQPL